MEKTYDEVINTIKELYLKACSNKGFADEYDYNGSEYYQCERTNYAYGATAALENLINALGIEVPQEEINVAIRAGRKEATKENNEIYDYDNEEDEED